MRSIFFSLIVIASATSAAHAATRVGWVETIRLDAVATPIKAKLDTGAKTSSIDAEIIDITPITPKPKHGSGEKVVFSIAVEGEKKTFEREIVRYVRIKKKGGGFIRRPVIQMGFCIADKRVVEEVNLADRDNFIYPILIGRNMMTHAGLLIDASTRFITKPRCRDVRAALN